MLHLTKIGQQFTSQLQKLLEPILQSGVIQHRYLSGKDTGNFGINIFTSLLQFRNPYFRISLAPHAYLTQQFKQGKKSRLCSNKSTFSQAFQPGQRLFSSRRQVKVRFIRPVWIEFTQPTLLVIGPVIQVALRRTRKLVSTLLLAQGKQFIFQSLNQISL